MSLYHSSKYKLKNIQRTIDTLLDGDFPVGAGKFALEKLQSVFSGFDKRLDLAQALGDTENLGQVTQNLNVKIYEALPILGFILRSTNVRNAFEMLEPLHAIAQAALQGKPQLILSSEWDYVPFAYPQSLENLKSFILIGLPASEAASALLMPLAGHELGHAVWRNQGIGASLQPTLQSRCQHCYHLPDRMTEFRNHFPDYNEGDWVSKQLLPDAIGESVSYAGRHAEELFSDLFAYACFGPSYLRAFAYILAPGDGASDAKYPKKSTRIGVIQTVAAQESVTLPDLKALGFVPDGRRGDARHQFIIRMAEEAVADVVDELWNIVLKIVQRAPLIRPRPTQAALHLRNLQVGIPCPEVESVGNIINAGWLRYDELISTENDPTQLSDKLAGLNELLLKTIEVFEYKRRVS
jgi:hypothetical protein